MLRGWSVLGGAVVALAVSAPAAGQVIGGTVDMGDPAVGKLFLSGGYCTASFISDTVLVTAAHCVYQDGAYRVGLDSGASFPVREVLVHRRYLRGSEYFSNDIALVRIDGSLADVALAPVPWNDRDLGGLLAYGDTVRAAGYGATEQGGGGGGDKHTISVPVKAVLPQAVNFGSAGATVCYGDSGGPLFADLGGGEEMVAVHSFGVPGCFAAGTSIRVDYYAADFIIPAIDMWEGACMADGACVTDGCRTPDPDCDPCAPQGECVEGCATPDWDCPIGGLLGDLCEEANDCESRLCVQAQDDPRVHFCTEPCDPAEPDLWCPLIMECSAVDGDPVCVYLPPTPGAEGSRCATGADCRSGVCHPTLGECLEHCSSDDDCQSGYDCLPASDQTLFCLRSPPSGGCRSARSPAGAGSALLLALLVLVLSRPRR